MKKFLLFVCSFLMALHIGWAQERVVSGKVTSTEDGSPLPGVNVVIKGTTSGTVTDASGSYQLSVPSSNSSIVFSFIGLRSQEVVVGERSVIDVSLSLDVTQLSDVVVTALGIERDKSSLGYATQQVSGDNIRIARETNVNTALAGKIAGVQIVSGSGAKFGAPAIRIRGSRGLSPGDPLYVLDGIVISDPTSINMDNIQDINVLKGANASALYGSRAREGVVIMTSKKGSGDAVNISLNHTTTFEKVYVLPEYQNEYGGGYSEDSFPIFNFNPAVHDPALAGLNGSPMTEFYADESWGPKLDGTLVAQWDAFTKGTNNYGRATPWVPNPDNVRDFYRTGVMNNTGLTIGKSGNNYALNTTFTKSTRTGVMENTSQDKIYFNINFMAKLSKKLELQAAANYNKSNTFGNLNEGYNFGGFNFNQWFQRQLDMKQMKQYYRRPDGSFTSWNINSPSDPTPLYWDNPYTVVYANTAEAESQLYNAKFALNYEIIPGLKAAIQMTRNAENSFVNTQTASGTLAIANFTTATTQSVEDNIQGLLSFDKRIGEQFSIVGNAGFNLRKNSLDLWNMATSGGLSVPNLFNISASVDPAIIANANAEAKVNSFFFQGSFGYKDMLYLDGTFRRDYDSRLPNGKNNYDYPSVSTSFVFSELLNLNFLSFGKVRASYAKVGNEIGFYQTRQTYALGTSYDGDAVTAVPNNLVDPNLRAATTSAIEAGIELGFLSNRIKTEFSFYNYDNKDELLAIAIPASSGGTGFLTNSVSSYTRGVELSIGGTPIKDLRGFNWDVNINISRNIQFIEKLGYGLTSITLANGFGGNGLNSGFGGAIAVARENTEWGMIVGRKFRRDADGNLVVNSAGKPLMDLNQDIGNILPRYTGGIFNRVTYKNFELAFTVDYQIGGKFFSITKMFSAYSGISAETVGNNDKGNPMRDDPTEGGGLTFGGVYADGTPNTRYISAQEYWKALYPIHERWTYDATYVKMRELRLGYNLPKGLVEKTGFLKGASIAVVANNPFLLYTKVKGIDPSEIAGDSNLGAVETVNARNNGVRARNNGAWVESANLPGTRSFGFDLRLKM